ncbi:MAG: rhodanese-like domain-containing protein [Bryobacteraceae bacterium]
MSTHHKQHSPGFLALTADAKQHVQELNIEQYNAQYLSGTPQEHILVDVREDREWADGRAKGAIHLSRGIIERDIETMVPDKSKRIICYCGGGYRSALVAESLGKMGYTDVWSLDGGWREWTAAGLPVEQPEQKA